MTRPAPTAPPDPRPKRPRHVIPKGACDCHFHIFDAPSREIDGRSYSASVAPWTAYQNMQKTLGLDRGVVVQPSVYGTDNETTLQTAERGPNMRAIVVVDGNVQPETLRALTRRGAVGARLNLLFPGGGHLASLDRLMHRLADVGWHLQILADISQLSGIETLLSTAPVPLVFDHFGHAPGARIWENPNVQTLLRHLAQGNVWVKLSAAYRIAPDMGSAKDLAQVLVATNPDRLVWGTDWPHPAHCGKMPNDGDLLDALFDWVSGDVAQRILVQNPETLYGFEPHGDADAK